MRRKLLLFLWVTGHLFSQWMLFSLSRLRLHYVITQFDFSGNPSGKLPATSFYVLMILVLVLVNGVLIFLWTQLDRFWPAGINLPHKAYWTSTPELSMKGKEVTKDILGLVGAFTGIVFAYSFWIIRLANLGGRPGSGPLLLLLSATLGFFFFLWWFSRPPRSRNS